MGTLRQRIDDLATRMGNYLRDSVILRLLPPGGTIGQVLTKTTSALDYAVNWQTPAGGGSDPYTRKKLAADYTNATVTFTNITDGTTVLQFTPPANADWEAEAWLMIQTATAANLPRVGVNVAAQGTGSYGTVSIEQAGASATTEVAAHGSFNTALVNVQVPVGGLAAANTPYECFIKIKGRSGAAPAAISLQMAAETAGANICFVKRGSSLKYMTLA